MKFIEKPNCPFEDRKEKEPNVKAIDVLMLTLDAEDFLEKCLFSIFREIPVNRLIVCDGGSKDSTIEILKKFPRVEVFVKPEIRTTGKGLEFLFSNVNSEWFVLIDGDIELTKGWYDDMIKNNQYDVLENSNRISAYHLYRQDTSKLKEDERALGMCHLIRTKAVENYHCDDDYMWRYTDLLLRQMVEKNNFSYKKVDSTFHVHNETERMAYESDKEKNYRKLVWDEPKWVIIDKTKEANHNLKHAKAVVKYLDPNFPFIKNIKWLDNVIRVLDRDWVAKNGPAWLDRYDHGKSTKYSIKRLIYKKFFSKKKKS